MRRRGRKLGWGVKMSSCTGPCGSVVDTGFTPDDGLAEVTVKRRRTNAWQFPVSTVKSRAGVERESVLEDFLVKETKGAPSGKRLYLWRKKLWLVYTHDPVEKEKLHLCIHRG